MLKIIYLQNKNEPLENFCHTVVTCVLLPGTTCSNNFRDSFGGIDSPGLCVEVTVMLVNSVVDMKQHDDTVSVTTFDGFTEVIIVC